MSTQLPKTVIALVTAGHNSVIKKLLEQLANKHTFEFIFVETIEAANKEIKKCLYGLFIIEVIDKSSFINSLAILKKNKKLLSGNHMKVGSFNHMENIKVENSLKKSGVDDFFDLFINPKSFSFKLDFWFKTLRKKNISLNSNDSSAVHVGSGARGGNGEDPKRKRYEVVVVPALDLENDIWLCVDPADCKNILRRWLVKLVGPSPYTGKWEQDNLKKNRNVSVWKFIFEKEHKLLFIEGQGHWCSEGTKPDYDWNENKWIFSGAAPSLFWEGETADYDYKFQYNNGALHLAANSMFAETKKDSIHSTFDKDFQFGGEQAQAETAESVKGSTESISSNMRGESSSSAEELGHLEGSIDALGEGFDDIKGKIKSGTDNLGTGQMSNKSKFQESAKKDMQGKMSGGDNSASSHMSNKSEYQEKTDKDMQGKMDGGDNLGPSHMSNDNQYRETAQKDMQGKMDGGDNLGPSHMSNDNQYRETAQKDMQGKIKGKDADSTKKGSGLIGKKDQRDDVFQGIVGKGKDRAKSAGNEMNSETDDKNQKSKSNDRDGSIEYMEDILAPKVYAKSSDTKKRKEGTSDYQQTKGYEFEDEDEDSAPKDKGTIYDDFDPEASVAAEAQPEQISETQIKEMTESGEVKIVIEKKNGDDVVQYVGGLEDMFEPELVVTIPKNKFKHKENVSVYMLIKYQDNKVSMTMNGVVNEVEEDENPDKEILLVELQDYDAEKIELFMELYLKRQENIQKFLDLAKGVA
jgi:hypothetical protein